METIRSLLRYYAGAFSLDEATSKLAGQLSERLFPSMKENMVEFG